MLIFKQGDFPREMSNYTLVKKRLTILLWLAIFVCLLPFLLLPFLNSMAGDDYQFYDLYRVHGFWGTQEFIYHGWAGRYTTTFLNGSFVTLDILHRYYWMPCLLLFGCTWGALFFLLSTLHGLLPGRPFGRARIAQASFLFLILFLYVQAEIATGFYWFSSAIVYQPSFILSVVFAACLVRRLSVAGSKQSLDVLILLLIVLIVGCNEMAAVFLLLFLVALIGYWHYGRRPVPSYLWLYAGVALAICLIVASTSGVLWGRRRLMNGSTSYLKILPIVFFQFAAVFFSVFKEPLFWFSCVAGFLFGMRVARDSAGIGPLFIFREKRVLLAGLVLLPVLVFLCLAIMLVGSRGSLPPRALNNLTDWLAGGLLLLSFCAGIRKGSAVPAPGALGLPPVLLTGVLVLLLFASVNYRDAWKTVLSGYFYHAVAVDRDRHLTAAGRRHDGVAIVPAYAEAVEDKIHQVFPHGIFESVNSLLLERPPLFYYYDGAAGKDRAYRLYYGLDSIIIGRQKIR